MCKNQFFKPKPTIYVKYKKFCTGIKPDFI